MELDELKNLWIQHEKILVKNTLLNRELLRMALITNAGRRIDWLKIRTLLSLIFPFAVIVFVLIPRIEFTFEPGTIVGLSLFGPLFILTYIWAIRVYLLLENLNFDGSILAVSRQVKRVEKYKLKVTRYGFILAPFMIVGIFLSVGIPFLSPKMIPFYALMLISFLIGSYVRSKHGLVAQMRKIESEFEEIAKLEAEAE